MHVASTYIQLEDVEGLYTGLCCSRGRPLCGGCPWCEQQGFYVRSRMTYPGAVLYLPRRPLEGTVEAGV
jgi:hypothetical protein